MSVIVGILGLFLFFSSLFSGFFFLGGLLSIFKGESGKIFVFFLIPLLFSVFTIYTYTTIKIDLKIKSAAIYKEMDAYYEKNDSDPPRELTNKWSWRFKKPGDTNRLFIVVFISSLVHIVSLLIFFKGADKQYKKKETKQEVEKKLNSLIESYLKDDSLDLNDLSPEIRKKVEAYKQGKKIEVEIDD